MFINLILNSIPRSLRAGIALVLTFILLPIGLDGLRDLILPGDDSRWVVFQCIFGLFLGAIAGVTFYYFQEVDSKPKEYQGLEVVHDYHKDKLEEERLKKVEATPAYPPDEDRNTKASERKI